MATPKIQQQLLTTKQAAEKTGLSSQTIWQAITDGKLKAFQPGGKKYLIFKPDLDSWFATSAPKPRIQPALFTPVDNSRNVEIALQAAKLMAEAQRLTQVAKELLEEIA